MAKPPPDVTSPKLSKNLKVQKNTVKMGVKCDVKGLTKIVVQTFLVTDAQAQFVTDKADTIVA